MGLALALPCSGTYTSSGLGVFKFGSFGCCRRSCCDVIACTILQQLFRTPFETSRINSDCRWQSEFGWLG
jgi:hypothetical protein